MLGQIYASLTPAIVAAVANMVWVSSPYLSSLAAPIDGGRTWRDGRRIFGDNKTWKGLLGVTVFGAIAGVVWAVILLVFGGVPYDLFFADRPFSVGHAAWTGMLLGFAYGLFELPNSFLKRRFDITPGLTASGPKRYLFILGDQIDSVVGCALVLAIFAHVSLGMFGAIIVVGGITHFVINLVLYVLRLRRTAL